MNKESLGTLSKGKVAVLGVAVALLATSLSVLMMSLAQPAEAAFPAGQLVTATATNPDGNTSEFSVGKWVTE